MRAIWKFPLDGPGEQTIDVPSNSHPLDVQTQHGKPVLWAIVDPEAPRRPVKIITVGTGWPIPDDAQHTDYYVGTYQYENHTMTLVFHVFWRPDV